MDVVIVVRLNPRAPPPPHSFSRMKEMQAQASQGGGASKQTNIHAFLSLSLLISQGDSRVISQSITLCILLLLLIIMSCAMHSLPY